MNFIKKNKGVTIVALVITIIILLILASISYYEGKNIIQNSKVESHLTNMMSIKAKAKVVAEEVNAQIWNISVSGDDEADSADKTKNAKKTKRQEILTADPYSMKTTYELKQEQISEIDDEVKNSDYEYYQMTDKTLEHMKLSEIGSGESYVIVYNSDDYTKLDVVYVLGIKYNDNTYYTLSALQEARGE